MVNAQKETLRSIGNCELLEKIADSGMGAVYKGRNRITGETVAVKVMPPFESDNTQALQRFARECRILSALNDPQIVRALDFGIDDASRNPYLITEFVVGESLGARLSREGRLPEADAIRLIAEVANVLGRAHSRGLVHRNVKPDKILITPDGKIKLSDLGLARQMDTQDLTRAGTILGTPNFMAPEQLTDARKATPLCDIYSLAATLYMAVTGKVPFAGCKLADMWARKLCNGLPAPKQLVPTLSDRTDQAIRRAMNPEPKDRPATCAEFINELPCADEVDPQSILAEPLAATGTETGGCSAVGPTDTMRMSELPFPIADDPRDAFGWQKWLAVGLVAAALLSGLILLSS